jgi:hypothetical protein
MQHRNEVTSSSVSDVDSYVIIRDLLKSYFQHTAGIHKAVANRNIIEILCFWTLSIVLILFKNTILRRLDSISVFKWNPLSWA